MTAIEFSPHQVFLPRVLIVDDEVGVRSLIRYILEQQGYQVLEADEGAVAIRIAESCTSLQLLVSDVVMPGMNGRAVAEKVSELHPEVKVLFVSGYFDDAEIREGVRDERFHFMAKPFSRQSLVLKVREVLDEA